MSKFSIGMKDGNLNIISKGGGKAEFVKLHNELRVLLGKSERKVEK